MLSLIETIIRVVLFAIGLFIILTVITSSIRTFVLARSARDRLSSGIFRNFRRLFDLRVRKAQTYEARDRILAFYAPVTLVSLPIILLLLIGIGYALMFVAIGIDNLERAIELSGSSLLTLGFVNEDNFVLMLLEFTEATLGLILVALVIAYLPTMYSAFSRREMLITLLEVRAGSPPSALELLTRAYRIRGLEYLTELWEEWEKWFADLEESHTSLAPLIFFRSTKGQRSWITAAGAVLDGAALYASTLDVPRNPQAELCIRAGYLSLRHIADFFEMDYEPDPHFPAHPISISREEYDEVCEQLIAEGLPVRLNRDQCWQDFAGWRVNYDVVLLGLAALTMAPYAVWSSDRSQPIFQRRKSQRRALRRRNA